MPNFATLTPEQRQEMARRGGKAAQATGAGHRFTSEEAKKASLAAHAKKRAAKVKVSGTLTFS